MEFELFDDGHVVWRHLSEAICPNVTTPNFKSSKTIVENSDSTSSVEGESVVKEECPNPNDPNPRVEIPMFECSSYEVVFGKKTIGNSDVILSQMRFAAVRGQVVNFEVSYF